ncbi:tetratricopeptide repeat protein [Desulfosporosinus meridiei]|uniref:Tetratricopeptide repeat protein n=1 Tax=Desulfosporosinus meridiei (strain ATCC BAA-275 / DSM 13257 / KCTC 12902 / NCIMB 13706 / S10) TaxID=768704 RepID=J7IRX9_DESMD|nr:hypothetical protein [Desulfosporosinus meridiei]AFQ44632.1 hypothetical protein Desmer_2721 [Desulfosporosinus meridiei DSM 13257]
MSSIQYDPEILYVQKLYFFLYLATISILIALIIIVYVDLRSGLYSLAVGFGLSYIGMVMKKNFNPPGKRLSAQRMAHTISQDSSPLSIAGFASQLYYYFHEPTQAISILEKFLSSQDPLLCMTLGDILLKEGKPMRALYILRDNPHALVDPLLLATQGRVLIQINKIPEAVKMFERSIHLAKQNKFPKSSNNWITQKILTVSYLANIHHSLADCYIMLNDFHLAKKHYRSGNYRVFDVSLWRHCPSVQLDSTKNHKNTK